METALIVPIAIDALVVNDPAANFVRARMNYNNLSELQSPSPGPFQEDDVQPAFSAIAANRGVYLQWELPGGLRHASQDPITRAARFPLIPNRWLVTRYFRPAGADPASPPAAAAWVLESDYLGAGATTPYLHPSNAQPTLIGRRIPLTAGTDWQEPGGEPFLTAVAPGNPYFTAYQPFNENVLSFHDDLVSQGVPAGQASYSVIGWYSDATRDPLAPGDRTFNQVLDGLRFRLAADAPPSPLSRSIYQGMVVDVAWAPTGPAPPSPRDGAKPQVAIGNTSTDAITAFIAAALAGAPSLPAGLDATSAAALLEAFQYNVVSMLDAPGGDARLGEAIRAQWFASQPGGTLWQIVDREVPPGQGPPPPVDAAELAREASWLATLNLVQSKLDANQRKLQTLQARIYELWWKQQASSISQAEGGDNPWGTTLAQFQSALDPANPASPVAQAQALVAANQQLIGQLPFSPDPSKLAAVIDEFGTAQGRLPAQRALKAVAQPRFWQASDPAVVVSGTGHDELLDPDAVVECRSSTQILSALVLRGPSGPFTVTATQLAIALPVIKTGGLPPLIPSLVAELWLLDPGNAALIAKMALDSTVAAVVQVVTASFASATALAGQAVPALRPAAWSQPWRPLFLDWEVEWYAIPLEAGGTSNWTFDGSDYHFEGGTVPTGAPVSGRSLITPKPAFDLRSRITQLVREHAGTPIGAALGDGGKLLAALDGWDFLSQQLVGFGVQLALRNPIPGPLSTDPILGPLTDAVAQPPQSLLMAAPRGSQAPPPSSFEGLRSGQLAFNRLTVVDRFGQTLEVITSQTSASFHPYRADGLVPHQAVVKVEPARFVELPPRVLQAARLNFQFMQGTGPIDPVAGVNPLLGWILPNHLDQSIALYGPLGESYGELFVGTSTAGALEVHFERTSGAPTLADLAAANPDLAGFVSQLIAAGPPAFHNFAAAIDETLWSIDPLGQRSDTFLSVLLGRPLALARASLRLELQTAPLGDPSWPYTFAPQAPLLSSRRFPIRLGDVEDRQDGLLGYFAGGDYSVFNAVHVPAEVAPDPSGYLRAVGGSNYPLLSFDPQVAPEQVTLIVDPRAAVHAISGILPIQDLALPAPLVEEVLARFEATFRTGPALVQRATVSLPGGVVAPALALAVPAERNGTWTWLELDSAGWTAQALAPVDGTAQFSAELPSLREGLLKLVLDLKSE